MSAQAVTMPKAVRVIPAKPEYSGKSNSDFRPKRVAAYGCITSYDEADQLLLISHKGVHLTAINPEGFMFYNSKDLTDPESREVFSHLTDDAETVREYVGLYESAPQMKPKDVQNYRVTSPREQDRQADL